jgi:predicted ATPase
MNWCLFLSGWALASGGDESGIDRMQEGEMKLLDSGTRLRTSWYALLRAERLLAFDRVDEAEAVFKIAEQRLAESNERWQEAEFHRIRGLLRARRGETAAAETCWRDAVAAARRNASRMQELRASCELARSLLADGRSNEIPALLGSLLQTVKGGTSTDVENARQLLAAVASEPRIA